LATAEDKEAVKAEIKALENARAEVIQKANADILSVLTPDQQAIWKGYQLCQQMVVEHPDMDADQAAECRKLCNEAAKKLGALEGTPEEVEKATLQIKAQLEKNVASLLRPAENDEEDADEPAPEPQAMNQPAM
jgi:hypothetical protein